MLHSCTLPQRGTLHTQDIAANTHKPLQQTATLLQYHPTNSTRKHCYSSHRLHSLTTRTHAATDPEGRTASSAKQTYALSSKCMSAHHNATPRLCDRSTLRLRWALSPNRLASATPQTATAERALLSPPAQPPCTLLQLTHAWQAGIKRMQQPKPRCSPTAANSASSSNCLAAADFRPAPPVVSHSSTRLRMLPHRWFHRRMPRPLPPRMPRPPPLPGPIIDASGASLRGFLTVSSTDRIRQAASVALCRQRQVTPVSSMSYRLVVGPWKNRLHSYTEAAALDTREYM